MVKEADGSLGQALQEAAEDRPKGGKENKGGTWKPRMGEAIGTSITCPQKKIARLGMRSSQDVFSSVCQS